MGGQCGLDDPEGGQQDRGDGPGDAGSTCEVHATWSVWTMVYTSANSPAVTVIGPDQTSRRWRGPSARDSARNSRANRNRTTPMGTFTKRIHRHDRYWVRKPPNSAPAAPPPAATALHTPSALARARCSVKRHREDGQRGRGQHGGTDALQGPGRDQGPLILGEPTDQAGPGEQDQSHQQDPAPPEQVGQPAPEQQQTAEGEGVGGHHPLEVGRAETAGSSGWRAGPH